MYDPQRLEIRKFGVKSSPLVKEQSKKRLLQESNKKIQAYNLRTKSCSNISVSPNIIIIIIFHIRGCSSIMLYNWPLSRLQTSYHTKSYFLYELSELSIKGFQTMGFFKTKIGLILAISIQVFFYLECS